MANQPKATTVAEVAVALPPQLKNDLLGKLRRHDELAGFIEKAKEEQSDIKREVEEDFAAAGAGNALFNGCKLDGWAIKMVLGKTTKLDEDMLMKEHGLSAADLDACRVTTDNTPYVKITAPRRAKA